MNHYVLGVVSVIPLQHRTILLSCFCQAGPTRLKLLALGPKTENEALIPSLHEQKKEVEFWRAGFFQPIRAI